MIYFHSPVHILLFTFLKFH